MPTLNVIQDGIAELPRGPALVVAIMGGTNGIGCYIAKSFATTFKDHGSKLRVYIIGRKPTDGEAILKFGRDTTPRSDWRFIQISDASLMSEVDRVCKDIVQQEEAAPFAGGPARLDVLYMGQALSPLQPSDLNKEGLDQQMSLMYYSRMRYIQQLMPLLLSTPTPAHVISVFAGSMEATVETPLGTPSKETYGVTTIRTHASFMKTFMFEELAEKHAGKISFIHIFPGLVDGPTFYSTANPWYFRALWRIFKPLVSWYMTAPSDCGAVMVYLATQRFPAKGTVVPVGENKVIGGVCYSSQRELGGGAYSVGQRADELKYVSYEKIRKSDTAKKVWDHTMETLDAARKKSGVL